MKHRHQQAVVKIDPEVLTKGVKSVVSYLKREALKARREGDKEVDGSPEYCSAHGKADGLAKAANVVKRTLLRGELIVELKPGVKKAGVR